MHGEFLRLLLLQAHRETEAHFTATGMPSQHNQSDSFCFKRDAFYQSLKNKAVEHLADSVSGPSACPCNREIPGSKVQKEFTVTVCGD
jgi:Mn-dependent DtxR family transcriptional regulator